MHGTHQNGDKFEVISELFIRGNVQAPRKPSRRMKGQSPQDRPPPGKTGVSDMRIFPYALTLDVHACNHRFVSNFLVILSIRLCCYQYLSCIKIH